ncbi:DUF7827 domain-containing protein [Haloarchaeobius amylolyticus]|uniref:DUF7827 domain-containing protein n=1 Tax=Haloarchaeobius amylolyticus TaxID=1198296 RepID=UPI00226FF9CF|nr:hypothetical protein [Haloarchaeobius amylolyticus]
MRLRLTATVVLALACCLAPLAGVTTASTGGTGAMDAQASTTPWSVPDRIVDQPGDPVVVPVRLGENETTATVTIANDSIGYRLTATVTDQNGDGRVFLVWNTYHAGVAPESSLDRVVSAGLDRVTNATRSSARREAHLPEGRYDVTVTHDDQQVAAGAVVLDIDPLRSQSMRVLEGPPEANATTALAQSSLSSAVELDEWLFIEVNDSSIHGYVTGVAGLTGRGTEGVTMHIQQKNGGPAVDLSEAEFVHRPQRDVFVLAFPPNTSSFEADATYRATFTVAESNPYAVTQERVIQDFRVLPAGAEQDGSNIEVVEVDAQESVIEGKDAMFTVTLLNSGERTGTATLNVSLDHVSTTREITLSPQTRTTVTVPVNTEPLTEGTIPYRVSVEGGERTLTGDLNVTLTGDPPNTNPTLAPRTEEGQPGFGLVAGVVAVLLLVGAARHRV